MQTNKQTNKEMQTKKYKEMQTKTNTIETKQNKEKKSKQPSKQKEITNKCK